MGNRILFIINCSGKNNWDYSWGQFPWWDGESRAAARKPCLRHLSRVQHNKTQHFRQIEFPLNDVLTYTVMSLMWCVMAVWQWSMMVVCLWKVVTMFPRVSCVMVGTVWTWCWWHECWWQQQLPPQKGVWVVTLSTFYFPRCCCCAGVGARAHTCNHEEWPHSTVARRAVSHCAGHRTSLALGNSAPAPPVDIHRGYCRYCRYCRY